MSQSETIISKCTGLFLRYGIKNLTMDEIARQLGISKKTIYQYVKNKSDLVHRVMQAHIDKEKLFLEDARRTAKNAIEENILMLTFMIREIQGFDSSLFHELQKYYPDSYDLFNEHREKVSLRHILNNLKTGMRDGWYRKDMNPEIVARVYVYALDILLDQQRFPSKKYHFFTLYKEFLNYHLAGIVTPKGAKFIAQSRILKSLMQ